MFALISQDQIPGVIVVNVFLFLSVILLLSVAFRVAYLALVQCFSSEPKPTPRAFVFFGSQLGFYAASLLMANLINGIAGLIGVTWLVEGRITEGLLCTIQAALMQFGNVSNGYFTAGIALHTFNSLVLRRRQSGLICFAFIAFGWLAAAAVAVAPELVLRPSGSSLYGLSGLSCGVKAEFPFFIFLFHLLPIFVTSLVSAILYSVIFLALRGTLSIRGGVKLTLDPNERQSTKGTDYQAFVGRLAKTMLWFPIAYILLLVPYSVTRLLMSSNTSVPFPVMVMAFVFWFLLGAVNVFILYKTFRILGPAMDGKINSSPTKDVESFAAIKDPRFSMVPPGGGARMGLQEKISEYRESGLRPTLRPLVLTHERKGSTSSDDSQMSARGLLAGQRFPSPIISSPIHARISAGTSPSHSRAGSWETSGLPAAPRLYPSPRSSNGSHFSRPSVSRVVPPARNSSLPMDAAGNELDIASWLEHHTQDSRQRQPLTLRLSAVSEGIPPAPATASTTISSYPTMFPHAPWPPAPVPLIDPSPMLQGSPRQAQARH